MPRKSFTPSRRRRVLAGDVLPSAPIVGTELLRQHFIPFLDAVDAIVGKDARVQLGKSYSWLSAWSERAEPASSRRRGDRMV
jgi:hypothetical protein